MSNVLQPLLGNLVDSEIPTRVHLRKGIIDGKSVAQGFIRHVDSDTCVVQECDLDADPTGWTATLPMSAIVFVATYESKEATPAPEPHKE